MRSGIESFCISFRTELSDLVRGGNFKAWNTGTIYTLAATSCRRLAVLQLYIQLEHIGTNYIYRQSTLAVLQ